MSKIATLVLLCMSAACSAVQASPQSPVAKVSPSVAPASQSSAALVRPSTMDAGRLRTRLAERRALNLQRLYAYAQAGQFPQNHVRPGKVNIFIDDAGHICAAANLIHLDGNKKLVQDTAASNNYIVLADVRKGPLMDWMLTSGFTQEEIARIQEPYFSLDEPMDPVQPQEVPTLTRLEIETARVQAVLFAVHKELSATTDKSLTVIASRLQDRPALASQFASPMQFAVAP